MKQKVLIIDDEAAFTNVVKLTLEAKGDYDVCVENNSRNAIATARAFIPNVIILDVVMPEFDGGEVHTQFKADPILKRVPIIFLTAIVKQREVDENHGMIGGSVYLAKPVSAEDLVKAIEANVHHS